MAQNLGIIAQEATFIYTKTTGDATLNPYFQSLSLAVKNMLVKEFPIGSKIFVRRELRLRVAENIVFIRLTNIVPPEATTIGPSTRFNVNFVSELDRQDTTRFFNDEIWYPNQDLRKSYDNLIGLDEIKEDMLRKLALLLIPDTVNNWANLNYGSDAPETLLNSLHERYPLMVLEGEVGAGKTALARSIGDKLAEVLNTRVVLLILNSQVRGNGLVGEISKNIVKAFEFAESLQDRERIPVLLLIDEADTLAQARGGLQMHHDDNAGVNTLIQRIDRLRGRYIMVLFATNLYQSFDSAILRRAVATYRFDRPNDQQRMKVFQRLIGNLNFSDADLHQLVELTKPRTIPTWNDHNGQSTLHRYTYSDITQRIIPAGVELSIGEGQPLSMRNMVRACHKTLPTPETAYSPGR